MEDSSNKHETPLYSDTDEARLLALRQEFAETSSSPSFVHTWLYSGEHGETLAVFLNQNSAWLMYRRHEDDSWLSARNPSYTGPRKHTYRYPLSNERWDEFPACGRISSDEALRVTEYLLRTGEAAHWLTWHTDLLEDEYDDTARLKTLEQEFAIARTSEPGDFWYERNSGEILNVFVNGDRAWLMYRQNEEDAGFSTRNTAYTGPKNATLPYVLDNGQRDEFPVAWTIATNEAMHAVEHFLLTGEKAPWLAWHDDYFPQECVRKNGKLLDILANGDRAWLRYRLHKIDPGFSPYDREFTGSEDIKYEFVLDSGQRVAYPISWTVPKEDADQAYSYFLRTGEKAPWLAWRNNSQE